MSDLRIVAWDDEVNRRRGIDQSPNERVNDSGGAGGRFLSLASGDVAAEGR